MGARTDSTMGAGGQAIHERYSEFHPVPWKFLTLEQKPSDRWDVDFSLALFNRSGKYFIGKDIVEQNKDLISGIYYWRIARKSMPNGLAARLIGKLEAWEHTVSIALGRNVSFGASGKSRCLHLDPLTVLHRRPTPDDLVICHDLGPLTHGDLFADAVSKGYDLAYRLISAAQPQLVFVSKSSAEVYAQLYGLPRESRVIYPPIRSASAAAGREACPGVQQPFLLTVGSIGKRKNQGTAIRAFARSGLANSGYSYVICGSKEPGHEEVVALALRTPGVILLPYVTDANLRWLYAQAIGFVLASHLEGFGMPVAEAMENGLIPVVSAGSVLEEVAGAGALSVDPHSEDSIAAGMAQVVSLDENARAVRMALLKHQIRQFSEIDFRAKWREALTA